MSLTTEIIEASLPGINSKGHRTNRPYKIFDSGGLYLMIPPVGRKLWRFRYRYGNKEKLLSLGIYPEVSLDEAREKRDFFLTLLKEGINPSEHVKMEREARRAEEDRQMAETRFAIDNDGALSFRMGKRCVILTPAETLELRTFLDATKAVNSKETSCL